MTKRKKQKPIVIEEHGVHVRLFKRGATWWLDVQGDGERKRVSAKTTDQDTAEENAGKLAEEIAKRQLLGVTPDTLTVAQLFVAYEEHKGRHLERQWKRASATRQRLFRAVWGDDTLVASISQTSVDAYSAARRKSYVAKQVTRYEKVKAKAKDPATFPPMPTPRPLRDGALDCDFRWLSSVFNWAVSHRTPDGKRLLGFNPMKDCRRPREKKDSIRRPIASHDRYARTLEQTNVVDPAGRFRLALVLARYTARRVDAILRLNASDMLRSAAAVRAALASAGQDERLAEHMTHGAIRWRADSDKQSIERITPISLLVRTEIDAYLAKNPRLGDVALFPMVEYRRNRAPKNAPTHLTRAVATKWLAQAERLAELPKLRGGLWHAYRRLWATERKNLPDVDVAEAGGWTGTKAMKQSYQHATPSGVLAAVNA